MIPGKTINKSNNFESHVLCWFSVFYFVCIVLFLCFKLFVEIASQDLLYIHNASVTTSVFLNEWSGAKYLNYF